jgi:hypothetical protein
MRTFVRLLMLHCCSTSSAFGRDSAEKLREHLIFSNQFVVEESGL